MCYGKAAAYGDVRSRSGTSGNLACPILFFRKVPPAVFGADLVHYLSDFCMTRHLVGTGTVNFVASVAEFHKGLANRYRGLNGHNAIGADSTQPIVDAGNERSRVLIVTQGVKSRKIRSIFVICITLRDEKRTSMISALCTKRIKHCHPHFYGHVHPGKVVWSFTAAPREVMSGVVAASYGFDEHFQPPCVRIR